MTFWFDDDENELVGNMAFDDEYGYASEEDGELQIDVETIMEEGRGVGKLREMKRAIDAAIEANDEN
ncbi:MAG: hypothetical protein SV760_00265 [Halobacteria archaeon]|nr:hypothetical protein [Halobacteria archaeon]